MDGMGAGRDTARAGHEQHEDRRHAGTAGGPRQHQAGLIPRPANARPGGPPPWRPDVGPPSLEEIRRVVHIRSAGDAPPAAPAASLLTLFESGGSVHVVLTRRSMALPTHPGEVALPGGRVHPGESMFDAAL